MEEANVRILCPKPVLTTKEPGLQWLIGSPFFPDPLAVVSTFRCIHTVSPQKIFSVDYSKESEDLRVLLLKGFHVIGALAVLKDGNAERVAGEAVEAARSIRKFLAAQGFRGTDVSYPIIGAVADVDTSDIRFFVCSSENVKSLKRASSVVYDNDPEKYVWEDGCLLHCKLPIKLPVYLPLNMKSNVAEMQQSAVDTVVATLKESKLACLVESSKKASSMSRPAIFRGSDLDFNIDLSSVKHYSKAAQDPDTKLLLCSNICVETMLGSKVFSAENADIIEVSLLLNSSENSPQSAAPVALYSPAAEETKLMVLEFNLDVICYAPRQLPLTQAVSKLIIPGLIDQLISMKNTVLEDLLTQQPQLHPYHFNPPGILHPVTAIYELRYGETEMKQGIFLEETLENNIIPLEMGWLVEAPRYSPSIFPSIEVRRSLHLRLGLPTDRPLLRISNALSFTEDSVRSNARQKGPFLLKDVHIGIPNSGVSGGAASLVQGSYEYYHYLQDGFDDSGWGCAYRSLQTIISWFKLQKYSSIDVPLHREIQQTLVEIGDKDTPFVGSREWIGAIELSFVLDKLLGVSCKVINVRSGAELPEKCRELAMHFETQGTPVMIGGGVLAYTLLGIDYNEASGDCAFLILDPHYTGSDEHKKIVNGGWIGWKKAVDSKGKSFFLHDKFYNLLLPQRPNMV